MTRETYYRLARAFALLAFIFLLWQAFFAYRIASVKNAVAKRVAAESSASFSNGTMTFDKFRVFPSESGPLTIDRATLRFPPLRNLAYFSFCEAHIAIGRSSRAHAAAVIASDGCEKFASALVSELLGSSKPSKVSYVIEFENQDSSIDRIFNFKLNSKIRLERFEIKGESGPSSSALGSLNADLIAESDGTCSVSVTRNYSGTYEFLCSSIPVSLIKPVTGRLLPSAGTGEVTLRFFSASVDLSCISPDIPSEAITAGTHRKTNEPTDTKPHAPSISGITGTVSNFEFFFSPFRSTLKADFAFKSDGGKLLLYDPAPSGPQSDTSNKLTGSVNLADGSASLEYLSPCFDLSCFSGAFTAAGGLIAHYSPSGNAKIYVKIEGTSSNPDIYGELSLNNAMLGGDAGFKNISNISGHVNFSNSRVTFSEISGLMASSKVSVAGAIDIGSNNEFKPDIRVTFSEMPAAELKNSIKFPGSDLEKILENITDGRVTLTVRVEEKIGSANKFYAEGEFARCNISFPMRPGSIALTEVGGTISISDDSISISKAYGFIGNVPFFFAGSIKRDSTPKYNFSIKFSNLDFSDVNIGETSFSSLFAVISRIQVRNRSRIEFKATANDDMKFAVDFLFDMSNPEFSLYPLPFTLQAENSDGFINFGYDLNSGAFVINALGFKLQGNSKITILTGNYLQIPVSISGAAYGELNLFKKADGESYINGSLGMKNGSMRYFDNKYFELLARINDLSSVFTIQRSVMSGACRFGVAGGVANLDYKCGFDSEKPMSQLSFFLENARLDDFYEENPKITKYVGGLVSLTLKNSLDGREKSTNPASGRVSLTNGFVANLSRFNRLSVQDTEPDSIFNFTKFGFDFSLSKTGLKIGSPNYEGSQKNDFLKMFTAFSETLLTMASQTGISHPQPQPVSAAPPASPDADSPGHSAEKTHSSPKTNPQAPPRTDETELNR